MSLAWALARAAAADLAPLPSVEVRLAAAVGHVLAADVVARTDLPSTTSSAMDGWAVRGAPPWSVEVAPLLLPGTARATATGRTLPPGTDAVLRTEHAGHDAAMGVVLPLAGIEPPPPGQDVRLRGTECVVGDVIARRGTRCVPAVLGLVAAAGVDVLTVVRRPVVDLLVLGDELIEEGVPDGRFVRDALGPMLPPWLLALGAESVIVQRLGDTVAALADAIGASAADLIVTTGSTASGPRDHLHAVLADLGAELVADGVGVRPGQPMLLARLADGRPLVGLPGNPLAAVSGVLTLAAPALRALAGLPAAPRVMTTLTEPATGHPRDVRLIPVRDAAPVHHVGPAMLRGLAVADALAVVPPGGAAAGDEVELLPLP